MSYFHPLHKLNRSFVNLRLKFAELPVCENKVSAKLFNEATNHDSLETVLNIFK